MGRSSGSREKERESPYYWVGAVAVGRKRESRSIMLGRSSGSGEKERESPYYWVGAVCRWGESCSCDIESWSQSQVQVCLPPSLPVCLSVCLRLAGINTVQSAAEAYRPGAGGGRATKGWEICIFNTNTYIFIPKVTPYFETSQPQEYPVVIFTVFKKY